MEFTAVFVEKKGLPLGNGGFGVVYKQEVNGTMRAVKWLKEKVPVKIVEAEAKALVKLQNENLVQFVGLAIDTGSVGLIMELMEGGDLLMYLHYSETDMPLDPEMQIRWSIQITSGLDYIHSIGVVHRDMKPANVLLSGDYQYAKISDFGLAKLKTQSKLSAADQSQGTPHYFAPELKMGKKNTVKSDVYALGLIIYEIYSRKMVDDAIEDEDVQVIQVAPIVKLIKSCLLFERDSRPDTTEILQILNEFNGNVPIDSSPKPRNVYNSAVPDFGDFTKPDISAYNSAIPDVVNGFSSMSMNSSSPGLNSQCSTNSFRQKSENSANKPALPPRGPPSNPGYGSLLEESSQNEDYESGMYYFDLKQYSNAFTYFEKAANTGFTKAEFRLGLMYDEGKGVETDFEKAMFWYHRAARKNHYDAMGLIGLLFLCGQGLEHDPTKAQEWLTMAMDGNSSYALYGFGEMYLDGLSVEADFSKAYDYLMKSSEKNNYYAQFRLGIMYLEGELLPQNFNLALQYLQKAGNQDYAPAQLHLGHMYVNGNGVPQDFGVGFNWYKRAGELGHPGASYMLGLYYKNGTVVPKSVSLALEWFHRGAVLGEPNAQYELGKMYESGTGVASSLEMANDWYTKAAEQGIEEANAKVKSLSLKLKVKNFLSIF